MGKREGKDLVPLTQLLQSYGIYTARDDVGVAEQLYGAVFFS